MPEGIVPWIKAASPAEYFSEGFARSAQIGIEQQRIQLAQAQMDREYLRNQQELEIAKAYKEAQLGMERAQLAETQRMNDLRWQNAARQFQAVQRFNAMRSSGMDPYKAMVENPEMLLGATGAMGAGWAGAVARGQSNLPEDLITTEDPFGNRYLQRSGHWYPARPELPTTLSPKDVLSAKRTRLQELKAEFSNQQNALSWSDEYIKTMDKKVRPVAEARKASAKALKAEIDALVQEIENMERASPALKGPPSYSTDEEEPQYPQVIPKTNSPAADYTYVPGQGLVKAKK